MDDQYYDVRDIYKPHIYLRKVNGDRKRMPLQLGEHACAVLHVRL